MAEIYLAIAEGEGQGDQGHRQFAIKVINQQNADDPDFVRMLVDEARLAVQLKHPNIVTTFDLGRENDQYYIVMELVEGADLFRLQQRAADQRLSLPIPLCAYIAREVARGLDYAHRLRDPEGLPLQVVHRDISPQNVLLSFDGAVKITDFGIAKAARRAAQTQTGIIKGKYYYMSPEQAAGQAIDGRTDIFAAGILLYEMLIGEMLYYDENVDRLLEAVRKADIPPVSQRRTDTPPTLERILMRALSKNAADRYQTAADYGDALDTYLRRYAPRFGTADVAAFLEKLVGEKVRRRALHEHTAALSVTAEALSAAPVIGPEKTVGLSAEQLRQAGIRDENSLIFNPKVQLAALLAGSSAEGSDSGARRGSDDSLIKTTQHLLDGPGASRRGSSSGTIEVAVPSLRTGESSSSGNLALGASEQLSGDSASSGRRAPRHTLRTHGALPPRPPASPPSEVFRAIEPEYEEELLAGAATLAPQPYALTGRRVISTFPRHLPLAEQLASSEVTVPRAEIPPELLAALKARPEERAAASRAEREAAAAAPRSPASLEQSSKVELLQSDLAFSDPSSISVEPSVELAQSDSHFSDPQLAPGDRRPGPHPVADGAGDASLDAISAESTHSNLAPPPRRPEPEPALLSSANEPAVAAPTPQRLWPYWVSGLGAALLSAGLTWYLTGPGAHRGGPTDANNRPVDLLLAGRSELTLILPETAIPDVEPPPTGEAPPTKSPGHVPAGHDSSEGADSGQVTLNSKPEGAEVYLNKKLVGQTPLTLQDLPTDRDLKVELRLTGYPNLRKRIKWHGKTSLEVTVRLPAAGETDSAPGDDGADAKSDPKAGTGKTESGAPAGGEN